MALAWPDAVFQSVLTVCITVVITTALAGWLIGATVLDAIDLLYRDEED
jgi:hypothetical protein